MSKKEISIYILKKILLFLASIFLVSVIVFYISRLAPGDPLVSYYGERVEKMGFYVIQVCINHSYDPSKMFKNYVVMENMNTFAIELGKAIKKATMTATKVSIL